MSSDSRARRPVGRGRHALVWYAAYGSNMATQRLACYLGGGVPRGGRRPQVAARNPAPARGWRPLTLPLRLRFADRSLVWGGGKAFVDLDAAGTTRARAWLVTHEQFADLSAQESGRATDDGALHRLMAARQQGRRSVILGRGPYDRLVHCGLIGSAPVVTFTHPVRPRLRAPTRAYLRMLGVGLAEAHALDAAAAARYLARADGIGRSVLEIAAVLENLSGSAPDEQADRPATAEVLDALDGQQLVTGPVDPTGEGGR